MFSLCFVGLEAVLDEIEDLVKRNSQEFQAEVETLFETARAELTEVRVRMRVLCCGINIVCVIILLLMS